MCGECSKETRVATGGTWRRNDEEAADEATRHAQKKEPREESE